MIGNLLLQWMSEAESGRISDLRETAEWLARSVDLEIASYAAGRWVRDVSALGHCDVDWERDTWTISSPRISRLPEADGSAVLIGARGSKLLQPLGVAEIWSQTLRREGGVGEIPVPDTVLIQYESARELIELTAALGTEYSDCAPFELARELSTLSPGAPSAPPVRSDELRVLNEVSPRREFSVFVGDYQVAPDGLYCQQVRGRDFYLVRTSGQWFHCDLTTGIYLELHRRNVSVMRWRPEPGRGSAEIGELFVDWGAPMPVMHSRALTLCSGFTARFSSKAHTAIYDNVPLIIAREVATSLGQDLPHLPPGKAIK
jgi:hypothetical protein